MNTPIKRSTHIYTRVEQKMGGYYRESEFPFSVYSSIYEYVGYGNFTYYKPIKSHGLHESKKCRGTLI